MIETNEDIWVQRIAEKIADISDTAESCQEIITELANTFDCRISEEYPHIEELLDYLNEKLNDLMEARNPLKVYVGLRFISRGYNGIYDLLSSILEKFLEEGERIGPPYYGHLGVST